MFGISEIAIILIVVILVIGAKKLPELARNAGKAARILKSEAKAMKSDGTPEQQATYQGNDSRPLENPAAQGDERRDASSGPASGNMRS
ncbi:twin-arginine translocase TatA/TatE family subunit [Streptomyces sp. NPDC101145]|uniref:twin-arginine translocase TatA/TatE family subunit n=1 Tax=Streptomyces sp. NPDC101145 TaxID=3366112 RepID=UPI00382478DF